MIFQGVVFHVETDTRIIPGLTIIRPYQVRPDKIFLPALLGANLQQDRLSIAISIAIPLCIQGGKHEVTVRISIPTPIDMERSILAVSVANKCMSTTTALTVIDHRITQIQLFTQHVFPLIPTVSLFLKIPDRGTITKHLG